VCQNTFGRAGERAAVSEGVLAHDGEGHDLGLGGGWVFGGFGVSNTIKKAKRSSWPS